MPTTIKFGKQLARSPLKPVRKHMRIAYESATFLPAAMQAFFNNDREALEETRKTVCELEADADALFEELLQHLPAPAYVAFERRDLVDVLEMQEAIANRMQEITALLLDLPMDAPGDMHKPLMRLVDRCVAATEVAYAIVKSIEQVVEAGFKGTHVEAARQLVQDVVAIETEADTVAGEITRLLFAQCRDMDPVAVVFLYQLVGWIDDLANYSERLAIRSQLLLIR